VKLVWEPAGNQRNYGVWVDIDGLSIGNLGPKGSKSASKKVRFRFTFSSKAKHGLYDGSVSLGSGTCKAGPDGSLLQLLGWSSDALAPACRWIWANAPMGRSDGHFSR